jgi:hypothetical protein
MSFAPDTVRRQSVLVALAVTGVAGIAVVGWAAWLLQGAPVAGGADASWVRPLAGPSTALEEQATDRDTLTHWAWVDHDAGMVAMPIDEAMAVVAGP